MTLRYRVKKLFAYEGKTITNNDEEAIKKLPRDVRDHHIERGNLVEWDDKKTVTPPVKGQAPTPPDSVNANEEE